MNRLLLWLRGLVSTIWDLMALFRVHRRQSVTTSGKTTQTRESSEIPAGAAAPTVASPGTEDVRRPSGNAGYATEEMASDDGAKQPPDLLPTSDVQPVPKASLEEGPSSEKVRGVEANSSDETQGQEAVGEPPDTEPSEGGRRRLPPEKRGGRPRGAASTRSRKAPTSERHQKPELVCWRQGMNWVIGLAVPEDAADREWSVRQASGILQEDSQRLGRWPLARPLGAVEARNGDEGPSHSFSDDAFRIFKLFGPSRDRGVLMQSLTHGRFLIVAPAEWEFNTENPGLEFPVAPEYLVGMHFRAHHVKLSQRATGHLPLLITHAGLCEQVPMARSAFNLEGELVTDADLDAGPLFHADPPRLQCLAGATYKTAVVGEEGPGDGSPRWRKSTSRFEELRPEIALRGSGWFFMRLYDQDDRLIESLDFRFSPKLRSIMVRADPAIPGAEGHKFALIDILHDDGVEVTPVVESPQSALPVARTSTESRIEIPPSPCFDRTRWLIKERDSAGVVVCLDVDRVWWALWDEQAQISESRWTDRPLILTHEDLAASSRKVLCVRLPPSWRAKEVRVGVEMVRSLKPRPVAGHPGEFELACRELGKFIEADTACSQPNLKLMIRSEGDGTPGWVEALLALMPIPPADIQPTFSPLRLQDLDPVRLMRVLTRVRRERRRYKTRIDELRHRYYRPLRRRRHGSRAQREAFVKEALGLLILVIKESNALGEDQPVPSRWARRAEIARRQLMW